MSLTGSVSVDEVIQNTYMILKGSHFKKAEYFRYPGYIQINQNHGLLKLAHEVRIYRDKHNIWVKFLPVGMGRTGRAPSPGRIKLIKDFMWTMSEQARSELKSTGVYGS